MYHTLIRLFTIPIALLALLAAPLGVQAQMSGNYDIGGGNNDFNSIVQAVDTLTALGLNGAVTFNIYPGTYNGQVTLDSAIHGVSAANTITFLGVTGASGEKPRVTNTTGGGSYEGSGFYIIGVDYVTIENLEITECNAYGIRVYYTAVDSSEFIVIKNNYIHDVGLTAGYQGLYFYRAKNIEVSWNEVEGDNYNLYMVYCDTLLVYNNLFYNSAYLAGLYILRCNEGEFYYNTVFSHNATRLAYFNTISGFKIKNNIFYTTTSVTGYAIMVSGTLPDECDYNCLYAPNTNVGQYSGAQLTLADWQAATGLDSHSVSADPLFISTGGETNVHIRTYQQSPVDGAGIPIPGITTDFDGDQRDANAPDIGGDEFDYLVPANGIAVSPYYQSKAGTAGSIVDYYYNVTNLGSTAGAFNLTVSGASWPTTIYDSAGVTTITATGNLSFLENEWVKVSHSIPVGTPGGAVDEGYLVASCAGAPAIADSGQFLSKTASMAGSFDIGGGNNDFSAITQAIDTLYALGLAGPCTLNVYTGTYPGMLYINYNMQGLCADNPLIIRAARGESPRITNTTGVSTMGSGAFIIGASYITIQGFEFDSCNYNGVQALNLGQDSVYNVKIANNYIHNIGLGGTARPIAFEGVENCAIIGNETQGGYYALYIYYSNGVYIANNMMYEIDYTGMMLNNLTNISVYFNSLYMNSTRTRTYCCYLPTCSNFRMKNNIMVNETSGANHYGMRMATVSDFELDYNCYYVPNGTFGSYGGNRASLAEWQTATGMEYHSLEGNPYFLSAAAPFDLHLADSSFCLGAGTPITGIEVDIDGDYRDSQDPCIGADEIYPAVRVAMTPHNQPIRIPAGGGFFYFIGSIENTTSDPLSTDIWTMMTLPNGTAWGPLVLRTGLPLQPGQNIVRMVTQWIPGFALPGIYTYTGNAGTYPDNIIDFGEFRFVKLAGDAIATHNNGWLVEGWFGDETTLTAIPTEYSLSNAYPNPFNPTTRIDFTLPQAGKAQLTVFDVTGREVATMVNGQIPAGHHSVIFDGESLASGIYFYKLTAQGFSDTKKMVLVK